MKTDFIAPNSYGTALRGPLSIAYASGVLQEAILVPPASDISVTLSFDAAGTAVVQGTNSSHDLIESGTAVWLDWLPGAVSAITQAIGKGMTAVRVSRSSGTPRITVVVP